MPKKLRGGPFGIFRHPFCRIISKNLRGPFGEKKFEKRSTMPKKLEGGPFSLARYCMLRGKKGKLFSILFARLNGSI